MKHKQKIFFAVGIYLMGAITTGYVYRSSILRDIEEHPVLDSAIAKLTFVHQKMLSLFSPGHSAPEHPNSIRINAVTPIDPTEINHLKKIRTENLNVTAFKIIPDNVRKKIISVSKKHKLDPDLMLDMAQAESGGNANAISRTGAVGIYQFTYKTALSVNLYNRFDPDENIRAAAQLTKKNIASLKKNDIKPNQSNIYLVHQVGLATALQSLKEKNTTSKNKTTPPQPVKMASLKNTQTRPSPPA